MHGVASHRVVNGERKTFGQTALLAEDGLVNTGIKLERINVGEQAVEEVCAETGLLSFIEMKARKQVLPGIIVNIDSHDT